MRNDDDTDVIDQDGVAPVEAPAQDAAPDDALPYEPLARKWGWVPKEEFRGDPADFRDAATFCEAQRDVTKSLRKEVKTLKTGMERMASHTETLIKTEREKARREAEEALAQAVEDGDVEAVKRINRAIVASEVAAPEPVVDYVAEFQADNPWFGVDEAATEYATLKSEQLGREGVSKAAQLPMIAAAVKKAFPHLSEAKQRKAPPIVSDPSRSVNPARPKSGADLPADARAAANEFIRDGVYKTVDEYAAVYWADQARRAA